MTGVGKIVKQFPNTLPKGQFITPILFSQEVKSAPINTFKKLSDSM